MMPITNRAKLGSKSIQIDSGIMPNPMMRREKPIRKIGSVLTAGRQLKRTRARRPTNSQV